MKANNAVPAYITVRHLLNYSLLSSISIPYTTQRKVCFLSKKVTQQDRNMVLRIFEIEFNSPTKTFIAGQTICGHVVTEVDQIEAKVQGRFNFTFYVIAYNNGWLLYSVISS